MLIDRRQLLLTGLALIPGSVGAAETSAKTFVLVPGAWHGAWCFRRLETLLRAQGHGVFAVTLSGLAERAHLLRPEIDLKTHTEDVVRLLESEDLQRVTLVGHSYAGMVVTQAAARLGGRLDEVVYLDAFVPDPGQSMFDLMRPQYVESWKKRAKERGDGWKVPPMLDAKSMGVAAADLGWVDARLTPQSLATFEQKADFDAQRWSKLRKRYVRCAQFSGFKPTADRVRALGWPVVELDCGHDAMLAAPRELAKALMG